MEMLNILKTWFGVYLNDLLRYVLFAGLGYFIVWKIGKNSWKHLMIQKVFPPIHKLWTEFKYSMLTVIIFSINGCIIVYSIRAGYTQVYYEVSEFGWTWLIVSMTIMTFVHDTYFYWTHRLMHHKSVFRYIHHVHHYSTNPSPWAAHSFHPLEAIIQALPFNIMLVSFPIHPIAITFFMIHMIFRNVIGHLGFEFFPTWFLKSFWTNWLTTSTHHNLHHKNFKSNFGLYYSWWDHWMGTTDVDYHTTFYEVKSRKKENPRRFKKLTTTLILVILVGLISTNYAQNQSVVGKWVTKDDITGNEMAIITIDSIGNSIVGKVDKIIIHPNQTLDPICSDCPGVYKNKKVIGMQILDEFKPSDSFWINGKILDPQNGTKYESKIWLEDDSTLNVRGYAGPFNIFYRTQTWKRISIGNCNVCGAWKTIDDRTKHPRSIVNIFMDGDMVKGKVQQLFYLPDEGPDPRCFECKGDMHMIKIVGMKILWGYQASDGKWVDGKIMDPGNGHVYSSSIWTVSENILSVRGYWGPFYRTQTWERLH